MDNLFKQHFAMIAPNIKLKALNPLTSKYFM